MKKVFLLFIISNFAVVFGFGQDSYIKDRWNFKAGYSLYKTNKSINNKTVSVRNYRIEANYGIFNYIEAGVYAGYSKFETRKIDWSDTTIFRKNSPALFYGVNCNIHLLPLLVKEDDFRFDLYLTGKMGGLYITSPVGFFPHGNESEYALGGGVSFYLFKHLGLFAEYSYGKFFFKDNEKFRYGLSLKF